MRDLDQPISCRCKKHQQHQTCVFASSGIRGSRSAFRCVRARSVDTLFFILRWARGNFYKKRIEASYAKLVFLHLVGSVGNVVHSSASARETSMHYFACPGGPRVVSIKSALGHVTPNLCFYNRWFLRVTLCILVRLGHEMSMHYFSYLGGPRAVSIKSAPGHVMPNLCFCIWWDLRFT
jgi:hypothetical protein